MLYSMIIFALPYPLFFDHAYSSAGDPIGGHINNYLLEKSRVVQQQPGDRNFHAFYLMLLGSSDQELASMHLTRNLKQYR
jgi:myosin-1